MQDNRVLAHGKIADISNGFKMQSAFSVYVKPKKLTMEHDVVINVRCICDDEVSALPVPLNDWSPAAIVELAPNTISLDEYDVYWGAVNHKF